MIGQTVRNREPEALQAPKLDVCGNQILNIQGPIIHVPFNWEEREGPLTLDEEDFIPLQAFG